MFKNIPRFKYFIIALLVSSDLIALLSSMAIAYWIRFGSGLFETLPDTKLFRLRELPFSGATDPKAYLMLSLWLIPAWLFIFAYFGLYEEQRYRQRANAYYNLFRAVSVGFFVLLGITFFYRVFSFSRLVMIFFIIFDFILTALLRILIHTIARKLRAKGFNNRRMIIIGSGRLARLVYKDIISDPGLGYTIIGVLDDKLRTGEREKAMQGLAPNLGKTSDVREIIYRNQVHEVFICDPEMHHDRVMDIVSDCDDMNVRIKIAGSLFEMLTRRAPGLLVYDGIPIIELKEGKVSGWQMAIKRLIDIVLASLLILITLPVSILVAILIKITSKGPVFFRQTRIGKDGKPIRIYKFRSMYKDTPEYAVAPNNLVDKRITPLGRILRKWSVDELPQLINVLKGEMSMVGPRPEMPFWVEKYKEWEKKRLKVKPGLTGMWQVHGRSDIPLQENIEYDLYYVRNQSLLLDFKILLKTIFVVAFGKGAY